MMEYAKVILPKVCFWKSLFEKEFVKCVRWTNANEMEELSDWCYENFFEMYPDVVDKVFTHFGFNSKEQDKSFISGSGISDQMQLNRRKTVDLPNHSNVLI